MAHGPYILAMCRTLATDKYSPTGGDNKPWKSRYAKLIFIVALFNERRPIFIRTIANWSRQLHNTVPIRRKQSRAQIEGGFVSIWYVSQLPRVTRCGGDQDSPKARVDCNCRAATLDEWDRACYYRPRLLVWIHFMFSQELVDSIRITRVIQL